MSSSNVLIEDLKIPASAGMTRVVNSMPMRFYLSLFLLISLMGCSALNNLDGLFALKGYSAEKDAQGKEVKAQNASFDLLKQDLKTGNTPHLNKVAAQKRYGAPLVIKQAPDHLEKWLYHPYGFSVKEKIYVYFNENGAFDHWEYIEDKQ